MIGLPLQAHTNVRDVLAPLFCNGRSFSSLIDELSRHFKFEPILSDSAYRDAAGVLEASSESQSTDSEAEVSAVDSSTSVPFYLAAQTVLALSKRDVHFVVQGR